MSAPTISVHDPDFKHLVTLPLRAVHHLPPAHLEISRLVLCRKFDARDPESCPMKDSCKFVHADLDVEGVITQSIHVNYAWKSLEEVTFGHLAPGEMVPVMAPNNRAPCVLVPSELLIATKGALSYHEGRGPLSHCAHFYFNRMCNRGDRCNFIHALYIDPSANEFQRAPPRAGGGYVNGAVPVAGSAARPIPRGFVSHTGSGSVSSESEMTRRSPPPAASHPGSFDGPSPKALSAFSESSCDVSSCESASEHDHEEVEGGKRIVDAMFSAPRAFRRNPYSLLQVTVQC